MKIETVRKNYWKGAFIFLLVVVVIGVVLITNGTFAKYSASQSVPLTRGVVNYKAYDFKIMAMYQENDSGGYDEITEMPTSGYVINEEESYCYTTTQEVHDDTAVLMTNDDGQHVFGNLKKSSKCYLWFDEKLPVSETIIENVPSIQSMPSITGISTDTSNTLYTVADDDGTSYVFRGNPSNNWVYFGGFYWRIIRINGDGSVRLIYNGTSTATTGTGTQIGASAFNTSYQDNAHLGYMYGTAGSSTYAATHANTHDSTIKDALDNWYISNLASYESYIDTNAGFCNDRQPVSGVLTGHGTEGYGTTSTTYAPLGRLKTNLVWKTTQTPSLKCTNASNDLYTMHSSNKGNKKLSNPVGLITSDEVVFAGGFAGADNTSYYLYTGQGYWTMSPGYCPNAAVFYVFASGEFNAYTVSGAFGVRPVINLKSDVTLSGEGTTSSPFTVS